MKQPIFLENSRVPIWLSKIVPIDIWALSIGLWVWCRGELSESVKRHETIHYRQQLELLFVGQWFLYGLFYLLGLVYYKDSNEAYYLNPFEREAYEHEEDENYLDVRKAYAWRHYRD